MAGGWLGIAADLKMGGPKPRRITSFGKSAKCADSYANGWCAMQGSKQRLVAAATTQKIKRAVCAMLATVMLRKGNPLLLLHRCLECFGLFPQLFFYLGKPGV